MAKVLLINPHSPTSLSQKERNIPLGILYLSSYLKKNGHKVKFIDINNEQISMRLIDKIFVLKEYYENLIKNVIFRFQPDLIGISVHYSGRFKPTVLLTKYLKKDYPGIPIVIGGIHPTIFPEEILTEYKSIDFVLQGESEVTIVQLINSLENKNVDFRNIDGLGYREDGDIVINKKDRFINDINSIPFPDYDLINIKDYYFRTSQWINPKGLPINLNLHILSSRSCPHQCTYCSMFLAHGPKYRMRSANNVLDEIEYLYNKFQHRYFSFMDDNFTLNKKRTFEICNGIIARGLNIQFDTPNGLEINTLDDEVVEALVQAGMVKCCLAIESGSPRIRKKIGKIYLREDMKTVWKYELFQGEDTLLYRVEFLSRKQYGNYQIPDVLVFSNDLQTRLRIDVDSIWPDVNLPPSVFILKPPG